MTKKAKSPFIAFMIYRFFVFSLLILSIQTSKAANIKALSALYNELYVTNFQPRHCGRNISNFLSVAKERGIDISNSSVLHLEGDGYWFFVSGFYSRMKPHERVNLGYFHMIYIADGYVFDFHLHEPLVLPFPEYVKLQFTPPADMKIILGQNYLEKGNPTKWSVTAYKPAEYAHHKEIPIWKGTLGDIVPKKVLEKTIRIRTK